MLVMRLQKTDSSESEIWKVFSYLYVAMFTWICFLLLCRSLQRLKMFMLDKNHLPLISPSLFHLTQSYTSISTVKGVLSFLHFSLASCLQAIAVSAHVSHPETGRSHSWGKEGKGGRRAQPRGPQAAAFSGPPTSGHWAPRVSRCCSASLWRGKSPGYRMEEEGWGRRWRLPLVSCVINI